MISCYCGRINALDGTFISVYFLMCAWFLRSYFSSSLLNWTLVHRLFFDYFFWCNVRRFFLHHVAETSLCCDTFAPLIFALFFVCPQYQSVAHVLLLLWLPRRKKTPIYFCIRYIFHRRCSYILSCWCISRCFCLFIHCFSLCFFLVRMCTALTKTPAVMECFWFCVHFTRWLFAWFYVFQFWWFDLRSLKTFTSDRNEKRDQKHYLIEIFRQDVRLVWASIKFMRLKWMTQK